MNARTLWDAGVTYGFGTDTGYHPKAGLAHELRALNLMFSPQDIVKLMGPNTAAFIEKGADLGTLELAPWHRSGSGHGEKLRVAVRLEAGAFARAPRVASSKRS